MKIDKNRNHDLKLMRMKSEQRCCQVLTIQKTQVIFILFLFERDEK